MAVGLLGDALAARAGLPYDDLLNERLLEPLGMNATAVTVPPQWSAKLLHGHSPRPGPSADPGLHAGGWKPALERR